MLSRGLLSIICTEASALEDGDCRSDARNCVLAGFQWNFVRVVPPLASTSLHGVDTPKLLHRPEGSPVLLDR